MVEQVVLLKIYTYFFHNLKFVGKKTEKRKTVEKEGKGKKSIEIKCWEKLSPNQEVEGKKHFVISARKTNIHINIYTPLIFT